MDQQAPAGPQVGRAGNGDIAQFGAKKPTWVSKHWDVKSYSQISAGRLLFSEALSEDPNLTARLAAQGVSYEDNKAKVAAVFTELIRTEDDLRIIAARLSTDGSLTHVTTQQELVDVGEALLSALRPTGNRQKLQAIFRPRLEANRVLVQRGAEEYLAVAHTESVTAARNTFSGEYRLVAAPLLNELRESGLLRDSEGYDYDTLTALLATSLSVEAIWAKDVASSNMETFENFQKRVDRYLSALGKHSGDERWKNRAMTREEAYQYGQQLIDAKPGARLQFKFPGGLEAAPALEALRVELTQGNVKVLERVRNPHHQSEDLWAKVLIGGHEWFVQVDERLAPGRFLKAVYGLTGWDADPNYPPILRMRSGDTNITIAKGHRARSSWARVEMHHRTGDTICTSSGGADLIAVQEAVKFAAKLGGMIRRAK